MQLANLNTKTPQEAALAYAQLGWPVFPLHHPIEDDDKVKCSCGKADCTNLGKHPRTPNGIEDASRDGRTIQNWWRRWPHANIGIRTGLTFLVIDIDAHKDGLISLPEMLAFEPNLKATLTAQTGGGGRHLYCKIPKNAGAVPNRVNVWQGIDIRADRGYVVAAPSLHASLQRYQWLADNTELTELSDAFIEKIKLRDGGAVPKDALRNSVIPQGQRNDSLFRIAAARAARGTEDLEDTLGFVRRVNHERCDPPLEDTEIVRIVQSAYTYPPNFLHTDLGNARALAHWFGKDLRWTGAFGWLEYDDGQWNEVTDIHIRSFAHELTGMLMTIAKKHDNDALLKWAHVSQSSGRISAMTHELSALVEMRSELFNANRFLLPCQNGVADLANSKFRLSMRDDYMTRRIPVRFNAAAACPVWESALSLWMDNDAELIAYVQRVVGYCITGDTRHQCLFILYGIGANGKSTFIRTLLALLGRFAMTLNSDILMKNTRINRETEIARLLGARLAVCSESASGGRMDAETVKRLTGGETITGRRVYKDAIEFAPTAKIMLHTNHKPKASAYDDALWRRIIPIPFERVIPKEQQNPLLPWQLLDELPGILAWAIRGTHEERLEDKTVMDFPKAVAIAKELYLEENDLVKEFLDEAIVQTDKIADRISFKELYARYADWCRRGRRGQPLEYKAFNKDMAKRGLQETLFHNLRMWGRTRFQAASAAQESIELERTL